MFLRKIRKSRGISFPGWRGEVSSSIEAIQEEGKGYHSTQSTFLVGKITVNFE